MVCMKSILVTNSYIVVTIKIANTIGEMKDAIFANGFGRITDLEIGPDGYMYVLSSEDDGAILYKISKAS
jgi:aldose sugar dehydrogenase